MASVTLTIKIDQQGLKAELDAAVRKIIEKLEPLGVLDVKVDDTTESVKKLDKEVQSTTKDAHSTRDAFASWGMIVTGIRQAMMGLKEVWDFLKKPIDVAGQFEQYEVQLTVMMDSAEKAKARLSELVDFAERTPFELPQVVEAANQLQALGKYSQENLRMLGDLASATGKPMEQVLDAYAKLTSGMKGRAVEMFRYLLITQDDWAKATGKKFSKNGELNASVEEMAAALPKIIKEKGFDGMMDAQSRTLKGMVSNLEDSITKILADLGGRFLPGAKEGLTFISSSIEMIANLTGSIMDLMGATNKESDALRGQQFEYNALIEILKDSTSSQDERSRAIADLQSKYPAYIKNIDLEKASVDELAAAQKIANEEFEKSIKMKAAEEIYSEKIKRMTELQRNLYDQQLALNKAIQSGESDKWVGGQNTGMTLGKRYEDNIRSIKQSLEQAKTDVTDFQSWLKSQDITLPDKSSATSTIVPKKEVIQSSESDLLKMMKDFSDARIALIQDERKKEEATNEAWYEEQKAKYKGNEEWTTLIKKQYDQKKLDTTNKFNSQEIIAQQNKIKAELSLHKDSLENSLAIEEADYQIKLNKDKITAFERGQLEVEHQANINKIKKEWGAKNQQLEKQLRQVYLDGVEDSEAKELMILNDKWKEEVQQYADSQGMMILLLIKYSKLRAEVTSKYDDQERREIQTRTREYERHFSFILDAADRSFSGQATFASQAKDYIISYLKQQLAHFIASKIAEATITTTTEAEKTAVTIAGTSTRAAANTAETASNLSTAASSMLAAIASAIRSLFETFSIFAIPMLAGVVALTVGVWNGVKSLLGFKEGGYTGDGNPDEEAGIVHKGEYVFEDEIVNQQPSKFDQLRMLMRGGVKPADVVEAVIRYKAKREEDSAAGIEPAMPATKNESRTSQDPAKPEKAIPGKYILLRNILDTGASLSEALYRIKTTITPPPIGPREALAGVNLNSIPSAASSAPQFSKLERLLQSMDDRLKKMEEKAATTEKKIVVDQVKLKGSDIYVSFKVEEKIQDKKKA